MSTLATRLENSRRDLVNVARNGAPEREWLPASPGMLLPGKRHLAAAAAKAGKSIAFLAHAVDMLDAGATVVVLDKENGADEYGRRLGDILKARGDQAASWQAVADRLHYYEHPRLLLTDGADLAATCTGADLVIFDSSRMFLSAANLAEDKSDDYARFMVGLVDPIAHAGTATLILDNTGFGEKERSRGTSAKIDLNEVIFTLKVIASPSPTRRGRLALNCTASRFGQTGSTWHIELGNGHYGAWTPQRTPAATDDGEPATWRPTGQMERISRAVEEHPGISARAIRQAVRGNNETKDLALELLVADGNVEARRDGRTTHHHSLKPFREPTVPTVPDRAPTVPGHTADHRAHVPPLGDMGTRARSEPDPLDAELERVAAKFGDNQ